ncbi:MAG TPA: glycosyl hydrolase family 28 protein [Kofleriaceae bacterium]
MRIACLLACATACGSTSHAMHGDAATSATSDAARDAAGSGATNGVYVVHETFDAMPSHAAPGSPWVTAGSAAVLEVPFPADKSVAIAGASSLSTTFAAQSGRIAIEAKVMAHETAGFKAIPYIYDGAGNAVASVAFQDGNLVAHVGATTATIQPFAANVWYRVRVVVDTNAGTFDLFVDGVRKEHAVALRTASSSIERISFYMDGAAPGTLNVDDVLVYNEAAYIGAPPAPVFDARSFGATGDGTTNDTAAIQAAIAAAAGTGGSVVVSGGTFLTGTLTLASSMTFYVDSSAVLLGSPNAADYPAQSPATGNTQLANCQRALLYAPAVHDLVVDGGGTLDGQGDSFTGVEATRPMILWAVLAQHVTVRNLYVRKGAVWSLVAMESDHVLFDNLNLQSNYITHDGIDIVDGSDITVQHCAIDAGDDAMCLKSGVRRGISGMTVRDSVFTGNNGGSNGIKVGTATYGAFTNVTFEDTWVKDVQYAAMAVESRQGADVEGMAFDRIEFANTGAAFFVYLAQDGTTHPTGDVPKLGSIDHVSFTDVIGATGPWGNSPHQGSLATGQIYDGTTYAITNLAFTRVAVAYDGGLATVPGAPPEGMPGQYPESNMFGDLPAWAYYVRHVRGLTFDTCTTTVANADARGELVTDDVTGLVGSP